MLKVLKNKQHDFFWYALFIYATMIVDIYRKINNVIVILPISTTLFRNIVYISLFVMIAFRLCRNGIKFSQVFAWSFCFCYLLLFSYLINIDRPGITTLLTNVLFMFISRLLPAMFIAKAIVGREQEFLSQICRLRFISMVYIVIIFMRPETSESAYITISGNLVLPVLTYLLVKGKSVFRLLNWTVGIAGLVVIIIFGGRGSLVACIAAVAMYFFFTTFEFNGKQTKKIVIVICGIFVFSSVFLFYEQILEFLLALNPTSRTLRLLSRGELLWASGRNSYYNAALDSFSNHPLRIYGFLGDRYYFSDFFGGGHTASFIETMYAHNVFFEWMLSFGVFFGAGISVFFVYRVIQTSRRLLYDNSKAVFFSVIGGTVIINMLTSSSYLNDYMIWFLWGWMAKYTHKLNGFHTK